MSSNAPSPRIHRPERKSTAEILKVWGPLMLVVAIGFAIAIAKLEPPAPRTFTIAAGAPVRGSRPACRPRTPS